MKESYWGFMIITIGVVSLTFIFFFQRLTNITEENYNLLRETTEAAMYDAVDIDTYKATGVIKINAEKFIENFLRRFSENASLANDYNIKIYDINETPPKVTLSVTSSASTTATNMQTMAGEKITFNMSEKLSAILETTY